MAMENEIYQADGFDDAIIGVDATEWFYFNVAGSEFGPGTPIWIDDTYNHND